MSSTNSPGLLVPLPIETSFDHDYFYAMDAFMNYRHWQCFPFYHHLSELGYNGVIVVECIKDKVHEGYNGPRVGLTYVRWMAE